MTGQCEYESRAAHILSKMVRGLLKQFSSLFATLTGVVVARQVFGHPGPRCHFESIHDLAVEIDRIVAAAGRDQLGTTGNWTPAQILEHLASSIEFSYDGFPFRKLALTNRGTRFEMGRLEAHDRSLSFSAGVYPGPPPPSTCAQCPGGLPCRRRTELRTGRIGRFAPGSPCFTSPFEGRLTNDQSIHVHLRHAELHLGFIMLIDT